MLSFILCVCACVCVCVCTYIQYICINIYSSGCKQRVLFLSTYNFALVECYILRFSSVTCGAKDCVCVCVCVCERAPLAAHGVSRCAVRYAVRYAVRMRAGGRVAPFSPVCAFRLGFKCVLCRRTCLLLHV